MFQVLVQNFAIAANMSMCGAFFGFHNSLFPWKKNMFGVTVRSVLVDLCPVAENISPNAKYAEES